MKLSIDDLDKAEVLLNLYNCALYKEKSYRGQIFLRGGTGLNIEKAREFDDANYVELVNFGCGPRFLCVKFKDSYICTSNYDRLHGAGLGERIINSMKDLKNRTHDFLDTMSNLNMNKMIQINDHLKKDEPQVEVQNSMSLTV